MKYLIAPSQQMGDYWAKQMWIPRKDYIVISRVNQIWGKRFKASEVIFVEEEPFDYPQLQSNHHRDNYNKLVMDLQSRIIMDI